MRGLTEGRIVHYVLQAQAANVAPEHRPAIVVKDWDHGQEGPGTVNLQVFLDGTNDRVQDPMYPHPNTEETIRGVGWRTSVMFSEEPKPGTWHWPEHTATDEAERKRSDDSQGG